MINFVKGLSKHTTSTLFLGVLFLCVISLRYVNDFFKAKNRSLQKRTLIFPCSLSFYSNKVAKDLSIHAYFFIL